jgi:hypothetical protein
MLGEPLEVSGETADEDEDFVDVVSDLRTNPLRGLFRAAVMVERARIDGDLDMEHIYKDLLVEVLTREGAFLDVAEAMARELVGKDNDATHLEMLARILEKTGREVEANMLRTKAASAEDSHRNREIEALVKERLAKYKK